MHELYRMLGSEWEAELQATADRIDAGLKASPRSKPLARGAFVRRTIERFARVKRTSVTTSDVTESR
jgi:hypothetical protein